MVRLTGVGRRSPAEPCGNDGRDEDNGRDQDDGRDGDIAGRNPPCDPGSCPCAACEVLLVSVTCPGLTKGYPSCWSSCVTSGCVSPSHCLKGWSPTPAAPPAHLVPSPATTTPDTSPVPIWAHLTRDGSPVSLWPCHGMDPTPTPAMSRAGQVPYALSIPCRAGAPVRWVFHVRGVPRVRLSVPHGSPSPWPLPCPPAARAPRTRHQPRRGRAIFNSCFCLI